MTPSPQTPEQVRAVTLAWGSVVAGLIAAFGLLFPATAALFFAAFVSFVPEEPSFRLTLWFVGIAWGLGGVGVAANTFRIWASLRRAPPRVPAILVATALPAAVAALPGVYVILAGVPQDHVLTLSRELAVLVAVLAVLVACLQLFVAALNRRTFREMAAGEGA